MKPYPLWLRRLRRGERVGVCYDGKAGRATEGRVVKQRPCFVVVEFVPWASPSTGPVRVRFTNGAGWHRQGTAMRSIAGTDGDCYTLAPLDMVKP